MDLEGSRRTEGAEAVRASALSVGDGLGVGVEGVEMGRRDARKEGKGMNRILRLRTNKKNGKGQTRRAITVRENQKSSGKLSTH